MMYTVFTGATGTIDRQFKTIDEAAKYCETTLKRDAVIHHVKDPFTPVKWFFMAQRPY